MKNEKPKILVEERGPEGLEYLRISPWPIDGRRGVQTLSVSYGAKTLPQYLGLIVFTGFGLPDGYRLTPNEARAFAEALNLAADKAEAAKGGA